MDFEEGLDINSQIRENGSDSLRIAITPPGYIDREVQSQGFKYKIVLMLAGGGTGTTNGHICRDTSTGKEEFQSSHVSFYSREHQCDLGGVEGDVVGFRIEATSGGNGLMLCAVDVG